MVSSPQGFFFSYFFMLIFCFSYDNSFDHTDNDHEDHHQHQHHHQHVSYPLSLLVHQAAIAVATASRGLRRDMSRAAGMFFFLFIYLANTYFRFTYCVEMAMVATATAPRSTVSSPGFIFNAYFLF